MFVWEERFRDLWGKEPTLAVSDLYSRNLQALSGSFISLGVAGTAAGVLVNYLPLITFFHGMVVLGVGAFVLNFFFVARWALLHKQYYPTEDDWQRFRRNFKGSLLNIVEKQPAVETGHCSNCNTSAG
jgi:hypothetical protein